MVDEWLVRSAQKYNKQGAKSMVLNMANAVNHGGGWAGGAQAQEEDLIRRSTYSTAICAGWTHIKYPLVEKLLLF